MPADDRAVIAHASKIPRPPSSPGGELRPTTLEPILFTGRSYNYPPNVSPLARALGPLSIKVGSQCDGGERSVPSCACPADVLESTLFVMGRPAFGTVAALFVIAASTGCRLGPSQQRIDCLQNCARYKDACILQSTTASAIQSCDTVAALCSQKCPE